MFGLGWTEIILLILILLIVFGSTRLPQIGEALGKGIKNFQKSMKGDPKKENEESDQKKE